MIQVRVWVSVWFRETHFFVPDAMHEALPVSPVLEISSGLGIINARELCLLLCKNDKAFHDTPRPHKTTTRDRARSTRNGQDPTTQYNTDNDKTRQTKTTQDRTTTD